MADYKKMYLTMFNATEDAINALEYISGPAQDKELESGGMAASAAT